MKENNSSFSKSRKKKLWSNFYSLTSVHIASYIFPILTIPYLVRILGVEKFGLIAFATATIQYFLLLTDYGFGLSATKKIAQEKHNINKIFTSVYLIKLSLLFLSFLILVLLINTFKIFHEESLLFYSMFGVVIGQVLFPVWFFQGIEQMKITAFINVLPKAIFTISIFIFIRNPEDYILVAVINSLGFIISGVLGLSIAMYTYKAKFVYVDNKFTQNQLIDGWYIFLGIVSSNYTLLNVTFLLGLLTNPIIVGYYSAIEKIVRPLSSLSRPIIGAIFPYLAKKSLEDKQKSIKMSQKISFYAATMMFCFGLILFIYSKEIVVFIFGVELIKASTYLQIMAFIPTINPIIHVFLIPSFIITANQKIYSKILVFSFFLSIILSISFIHFFGGIGAAITTIMIDLLTCCLFFYFYNKRIKV